MEKKNRISLTLIALAAAIILLAFITRWIYQDIKSGHLELGADQQIDITPQQILSIKEIGDWEFLSISDEEMVDTIRRGIFSDDQLVRIYYGTLRLGVNLKQVESGWITTKGDTIEITLPKIGLLDRDFIDEARTKSFYESGKWTAQDREALLHRAYQRMLQRGLTPQNIQRAEQNGNVQVRQVLQSMGFKQVNIKYKD
jgi:hypothetical protein